MINKLTQEIVEKYTRRDSKLGSHLKTLLQFSVVGFLETPSEMDKVRKTLEDEEIAHDCEQNKCLVWLEDGLSDSLKKTLKSKNTKK